MILAYITVYDSIFILDTNYVTMYDTVTYYDSLFVSVTDTLIINVNLSHFNTPNISNTLRIYPNPAIDVVLLLTMVILTQCLITVLKF